MTAKNYQVTKLKGWTIALAILVLLVLSPVAFSQSGGRFILEWGGVDNGVISTGGEFGAAATIGLSETETGMSGGKYTVQGGLDLSNEDEPGTTPGDGNIYLPAITR